MITLLLAAASLAPLQNQTPMWPMPYTASSHHYTTMLYFDDSAIVEIAEQELAIEERTTTSPKGRLQQRVLTMQATYVQPLELAGVELTLVFLYPAASRLDYAIEVPFAAGRYYVMGDRAEGRRMRSYGGRGVTTERPDHKTRYVYAIMHTEQEEEFAVYHIVPTELESLVSDESSASAVFQNLVAATLRATGDGVVSTATMLGRVQYQYYVYNGWDPATIPETVSPGLELLVRGLSERTESERGLLLLLAYKMGRYDIERQMIDSILEGSLADPEFWERDAVQNIVYGRRERHWEVLEPRGQKWAPRNAHLLRAAVRANTEPIRYLFVNMVNLDVLFEEMRDPVVSLLRNGDPEAHSTRALLIRLSKWFDEPDKYPGMYSRRSTWTNEELIAYWLGRLGG